MADTECTIKLDGGSFKLDQKIPKDLAARIAILVISDGKNDGSAAGGDDLTGSDDLGNAKLQTSLGRNASLSEYLIQHKAKKTPQRIATMGLYYQTKQKRNFFTREELVGGFEEARVRPPKNIHRDLGLTIKKGWIAPKSGVERQYYVTSTGEAAIAANFILPKGGSGRRKRRNKKAAKK